MTEALRDYLEQRFVKVRSGYGASDLTIGMAGETDLTVWVRRRLRTDPALRAALLGPDEHRLPMVFQYNPLETYLETTADGELLCTINSTAVLTPKLRYNIGDEARLRSFPEVLAAVPAQARDEALRAWRTDRMRLPLLFLFGRRDSTISYMGANIYPQDVEYGLYTDNPLAHLLQSFCLELEEHDDLEWWRTWPRSAATSPSRWRRTRRPATCGSWCTRSARARSPARRAGSRTSTW